MMKYILVAATACFLFSYCSSLRFEAPLPNIGQDVNSLPAQLAGTYQDAGDSAAFFKRYQHMAFLPKEKTWEMYIQDYVKIADLDTSKNAFVRNDSLFVVEQDSSGPQFVVKVVRKGNLFVAAKKLRYLLEPTKAVFVLYDENTGAPKKQNMALRKQGEVYFFNLKETGGQYWQTSTLQLTPQGLKIQHLSTPKGSIEDLPFATRAVAMETTEGSQDTIYVAKPSDLEINKYTNDKSGPATEYLIRVKEKQ